MLPAIELAHQATVLVDTALRQRHQPVRAYVQKRVPLPGWVLPDHAAAHLWREIWNDGFEACRITVLQGNQWQATQQRQRDEEVEMEASHIFAQQLQRVWFVGVQITATFH